MEKIILADGTEREVPTAEELAMLNKLQEEHQTLKTKMEVFENDPVQKNWNNLRQTNDKLKEALKAQGKEVKEDGTIVEAQKTFDPQELLNKASEVATARANEIATENYKRTLLSKYSDDEKKVIDHYYNKLMTGEQVTVENIDKFIGEASRLANPDQNNSSVQSFGGQPPRFSNTNQGQSDFAETDFGKQLANEVFGDDSYAKAK